MMRPRTRYRARWVVPTLVLAVSGCAPVPAVRTPPRPIPILLIPPPATPAAPRKTADTVAGPVVRCPTAADVRRLRAGRPKPLRTQPMPATPAERVARTAAQLGQYEAKDAWADQVEDAFARCERD